MNKDGSQYVQLHRFGEFENDGDIPYKGLLLGSDNAFYGTTLTGGRFGGGVVYRFGMDSLNVKIDSLEQPQPGRWLLQGSSPSGLTLELQTLTTLSSTNWAFLSTTTSSIPDGSWNFEDVTAVSTRFYRIIAP